MHVSKPSSFPTKQSPNKFANFLNSSIQGQNLDFKQALLLITSLRPFFTMVPLSGRWNLAGQSLSSLIVPTVHGMSKQFISISFFCGLYFFLNRSFSVQCVRGSYCFFTYLTSSVFFNVCLLFTCQCDVVSTSLLILELRLKFFQCS